MRALRRRHRNLRVVGVKLRAVERERLRLAERRAQITDEFARRRFARPVIQTERPEIIRIDAGNEAELHAAGPRLVDDGDFLGEAEWMIERHDVSHRPDAHALRARAGADRLKARRGHPAFVGTKMMLDAERMIETERVAQSELAPELLVALPRRHPGLGPDVG